jgi:hypothetical protein
VAVFKSFRMRTYLFLIVKLTLLFQVLLFCLAPVNGQEVVMDKTVTREMFKMNEGPNTSRFTHVFLSLGSFIKTSSLQADPSYPGSLQIGAGLRTKFKIAEWYALGYELEYRLSSFRYAKAHDSLQIHDKDKILTHSLALSLFQRFNFDKRGNYIGKFMDIGAYGEWPFARSNILIDNRDTLSSGQQKLILSHLKFMNSFNYGISARIGYNRIVIFALYRLSDIFKPNYNRIDLPRLTIGLQLGIHK